MPTKTTSDPEPLVPVESDELARVAGGSVRVVPTARKDDSGLVTMMTQVTQALASLGKKMQQGDPMSQMLPMVLAMSGKDKGPPPDDGGGGAPPPGAAPTRQA
jgi:hypothetical protein